jgi:ferric-dicitrate binding protein FerR (iron transport regulator)
MIAWHPRRSIDAHLAGQRSWHWSEPRLYRHLRACADCRAYFDEGVRMLRAARGGTTLPGAGELDRLVGRATEAIASVHPRRIVLRWALVGGVAAAAVSLAMFWVSGPRVAGNVASAGERLTIDGVVGLSTHDVHEGALVVAEKGSSVIALHGGRSIVMSEGAALRVRADGAETLLDRGRARFSVKREQGRFEVVAGEVSVTVHGTVFTVQRDPGGDVAVEVERGKVEVASGMSRAVLLEQQRTRVSAGTVAPPEAMTPSALPPGDVLLDEAKKAAGEAGRDVGKKIDSILHR